MSTYYMENKAEMVRYAGEQTKSIIISKETVRSWGTSFFDIRECSTYMIQMYTSETPQSRHYGDAVYVNKRTLKAYLRHLTGLSVKELDNELYSLNSRYLTTKHHEIWDKKVIVQCTI